MRLSRYDSEAERLSRGWTPRNTNRNRETGQETFFSLMSLLRGRRPDFRAAFIGVLRWFSRSSAGWGHYRAWWLVGTLRFMLAQHPAQAQTAPSARPPAPPQPSRNAYRHSDRPNLVLIVADDLGWGAIGCHGQKEISTPNIDRLATEGMRFTQAYAGSPVGAPSRCSLLTGKHSGHARIRSTDEIPLQSEDLTVAQVLRSAGYRTAAVGTWGLGGQNTPGHPRSQGFEEFYGYLTRTEAYHYYPATLWRNEQPIPLIGNNRGGQKVYSPDEFNLVATNVVRQFQAEPFFFLYTPTLPHANIELGTNGMEIPNAGVYATKPWPQPERNKAAMIGRLDEDVGRLLAALKFYQLEQETIILFTSGNGPHAEGGCATNFFHETGPFRGQKRELYEGGLRVPWLVRWPGKIRAGSTSERVVAFWDLFPTFAELARTPIPSGLDGLSFAPTLRGHPQTNQADHFYWESHDGGYRQAVRWDDWKAIRLDAGKALELYDLKADLGETNNIAAAHPELLARAESLLLTSAHPWIKPVSPDPAPSPSK